MKAPRRTRWIDWLGCSAFLAVGLMFLLIGEYARRHGTTPESELMEATGQASDVRISTYNGSYGATTKHVTFSVGEHRVEYSSDLSGYERLLSAAQNGTPLTIRVSTKRETLFPRKGWVPLYSLRIGDDVLLSYQDTVTKGYRGSNAPWIVGGVLTALSLLGLYTCVRNSNIPLTPAKSAPDCAPDCPPDCAPEALRMKTAAALSQRKQAAIIVTVLLFAALIYSVFAESAFWIRAFGPLAFGLPTPVSVAIIVTVLSLPAPWIAWHGMEILLRAKEIGMSSGTFGIFPALFTIGRHIPGLRRSQAIAIAGFFYFIVLMAAWICYAQTHGL